jgi:nucleotide-binding universal stress UspA family protein
VENVVTRETCPVMVVNRPAAEQQLRFHQVLVAVDFSRSCECAIRFAAKLATHYHSRLIVFHMIPVPPVPKYTRNDYMADVVHAKKRLESFYDAYLKGIDYHYLIRAGAMPHQEIATCAADNHADLILMGSHTKEKPGQWYPGSAVERVGYRTACPLVVVTDPGVLVHWNGAITNDAGNDKDRLIHVFTGTSPQKSGTGARGGEGGLVTGRDQLDR